MWVSGLGRDAWETRRNTYVRERLTRPVGGQIPYYERQHRKAHRWLSVANCFFYGGGFVALIATSMEIVHAFQTHHAPPGHGWSFLAIILPVLSVAAVSLAASFDLEARERTFREMALALEQQQKLLEGAKSEHEFVTLVLQTETRLLGEHVNWFARRVFTGVT